MSYVSPTYPSPEWYTMERTYNGIRTSWMGLSSGRGYYRHMLWQGYNAREVRALMAQMRREGRA